MSPKKPVQKNSITNHFTIIPKPKKPEPKLYPLFIKKKEEETKENVEPEPIVIKKKKVDPFVHVPSTKHRIKKDINIQVDPLKSLIGTHSCSFFNRQKILREQKESQYQSVPCTAQSFNKKSIEKWMNTHYPRWKKEACCKYLFNHMPELDNKILWCDSYRPQEIQGLIGFLPDFEFLRDWLNNLKVDNKDRKQAMAEDEEQVFNLILDRKSVV